MVSTQLCLVTGEVFGCDGSGRCQNSNFMSSPSEKAVHHMEVNVFKKSLLKMQSSAVTGF